MLGASALLLGAAAPPEARPVSYRVRPVVGKEGARALRVDIRFRGDADGETMLQLPDRWAGSEELWRHVARLRLRGARRAGGTPAQPLLRHARSAKIRVRYNIVSAWQQDPGFAYEKAWPMVRPDWFFVHGESLFAYPGERFAGPARFRWGKLPRGWRIASDLDHLNGGVTTIANMINSVAIGGTRLRVIERDIAGAPFRLAILGKWRFPPEALADLMARILVAEDRFWGDRSSPYLVAMAPLGDLPSGLSFTGTGRTDAFSIASTSAFELGLAARFLGHEYMHGWLPNELGAMPAQDEAADYWFSEGFADYLAAKVLLRGGIWSLAQYVADKNETLLRYGASPAKKATAADVAARFWTDYDIQQLSYDRGHLLAAWFDADIAARSDGRQSLDDVLREQRGRAPGSEELATSLFRKAMLDTAGIEVETEIEAYARRGEPLTLPPGLYAPCARLLTERRRSFDRGFDAEATRIAEGEIAGVDPDGPAYAAGMRDGMVLVDRVAGTVGDSSVEIAYRVLDDTGMHVIRYLPAGKGEHEVQRMVLTAHGPEEEARCTARLGGAP
jgi:predicted metalloprotease with PDZ domain